MRNRTIAKYHEAIENIHLSKEFHGTTFCKTYQLSNAIIPAMRELELIKEIRFGWYQWQLDRYPTITDIKTISKKINERNNNYKGIKKHHKKNTVVPILKAQAPTPMPVVDEPDYDNSNSKMLLIMAVGAVIGFLIATAIWK
jgi:hypothetical protein